MSIDVNQIQKLLAKEFPKVRSGSDALMAELLPTGHPALDYLCGGGVPVGKLVEIFGATHTSKCITSDTYVYTQDGLKTFKEMFLDHGQEMYCVTKEVDITDKNYRIYNEHGKLERVTHLTFNNRRKVFKLTTIQGTEIKATANHPLRVMSKDGHIVWRNLNEIAVGDCLVTSLHQIEPQVQSDRRAISIDEAKMLGFITADAHLRRTSVAFTKTYSDQHAEIIRVFKKVFPNIDPYLYGNSIRFNNVEMCSKLESIYEVKFAKSADKCVPKCILASQKEIIVAYLEAYFDFDGCFTNEGFGITTASAQLASEVRLLLRSLGIFSAVNPHFVKEYPDNTYYKLTVSGKNYGTFLDTFNLLSDRRLLQVTEPAELALSHAECVPNINALVRKLRDRVRKTGRDEHLMLTACSREQKVSIKNLQEIVEFFEPQISVEDLPSKQIIAYFKWLIAEPIVFEEVKSVEPLDPEPTFDVTMESSASFLANGILSHNSMLALTLARPVLERDKLIYICDCEGSIDRGYLQRAGLDPDRVVIEQTASLNKAISFYIKVMSDPESFACGAFIFDTVKGFQPEAATNKLSNDAESSLMASSARVWSNYHGTLIDLADHSGAVVFFVNHIMANLSPYSGMVSKPGGNTIPQICSLSLHIKGRGKKLADDLSSMPANYPGIMSVDIHVDKSRFGSFARQTTIDLCPDGYDPITSLLRLAKEQGTVPVVAARYIFNVDGKEVKLHGLGQAYTYLKDRPELVALLTQELATKVQPPS